MNILLGEGDGFLHGGETKNIIVHVTLDSGKKLQFPYVASRSLSELYADVLNISDEKIVSPTVTPCAVGSPGAAVVPPSVAPSFNEIGREDIVRCVKVENRGDGATVDLVVGNEYRVLKVVKQNGHVTSYDVADDKADTLRRIFVLPHEVVFVRKRKPLIPKVEGRVEELFVCPNCKQMVCCFKEEDGMFRGECIFCNTKSSFIGVRNEQSVNPETQNIQPAAA